MIIFIISLRYCFTGACEQIIISFGGRGENIRQTLFFEAGRNASVRVSQSECYTRLRGRIHNTVQLTVTLAKGDRIHHCGLGLLEPHICEPDDPPRSHPSGWIQLPFARVTAYYCASGSRAMIWLNISSNKQEYPQPRGKK